MPHFASSHDDKRSIGLLGATGIGVGAIVGGGILALAGVAFATTGPAAIVAFALNGLIAFLTALSFAEMSSAFPQSGGAYTFAKKVLSAEAAFIVGWVVWLASIVAAVLYALGFASYTIFAATTLWPTAVGNPAPAWLDGRLPMVALAVGATLFYSWSLIRRSAGGGQWATIGKTILFVVLIVAGFWALAGRPLAAVGSSLRPFFSGGAVGLVTAMGFTFIALQGFDLIAAVGGEVRDPERTIPRAMFLSLGAALVIYLPFLFLIATVGVEPGGSITAMSAANPATVVALAVSNFMGPFGLWLVTLAAVLSMLSALYANLFAASRVALIMARDRSLPEIIGGVHPTRGTPVRAVLATSAVVLLILAAVSDVAVAGAAASLIFLLSFALAHATAILTRKRGGVSSAGFRAPFFPLVPVVGGVACLALALYQGATVPAAGLITGVWLAVGFGLYFFRFASRAGVVDASSESLDPDLVRLRGRSPLVLVPIAKPASAPALVQVAQALAAPRVGRILMLSVLQPPGSWERGDLGQQLVDVQAILDQTFRLSLPFGSTPEWLTTVASSPWREIARVARIHRCESLLLGLGSLSEETNRDLEETISGIQSDVVILRGGEGWSLSTARRVLVPVGGRRDQSRLRARFLGSLCREGGREIVYLRVLPEETSDSQARRAEQELTLLARDEVRGAAEVRLLRSPDPLAELVRETAKADLLVTGLRRLGRRRRVISARTLEIARATSCPLVLIGQR